MKIGIDGRFWGIENTGIGRYLMELVGQLQKIDRENEYVVFLRRKYFFKLKFNSPRFRKVLADFPHYSFSEQLLFAGVLKKEKLDLVHFPHFNIPLFYRGSFVVTIHDLIKHQSRGSLTTTRWRLFYWFKYLAYLLVVNFAVKRAKMVIVPSHWWKRRMVKKFAISSRKVKVTYESVSSAYKKGFPLGDKKEAKKLLCKYEIKQPFVIYTGNLYPHKNVVSLVGAIKKINREKKLSLVIVCAKSTFWQRFKKEVDKQKMGDLVTLAGFVPDQELVRLYQQAEAFVFPSLLEGFGLPGLEAMAAGLPVICSRASCLPEIYQDAAQYFNPKNNRDIKDKILAVLNDRRLKKRLIRAGHERANQFSWQKMAQETLGAYNLAIGSERKSDDSNHRTF